MEKIFQYESMKGHWGIGKGIHDLNQGTICGTLSLIAINSNDSRLLGFWR